MPPVLHGQAKAGRHRRARRALRAPLRPAGGQEALTGEADSGSRLSELRQIKLRAVVAGYWGKAADPSSSSIPGGATLVEGGTGRGWVLVDDGDVGGLGAALVWAIKARVEDLYVVVESAPDPATAGAVARRAGALARPPAVFALHGRELTPAVAEPPAPALTPPPGALAFTVLIAAHDVEPVVEHGVVTGEILGLEVARVVAGSGDEEPWRLEVGVGRHDREARAQMRAGQDPFDALAEVATEVRAWRRAGAPRHPANTLARERWLRSVVMAFPGLVGATQLAPLPPARPKADLRKATPAPALGTDLGGRPLVVVCSTGVDVDLVATAADIRLAHAADARLVVAVPRGDDYPVTYTLAAALAHPADVVTVPTEWPGLTGRPGEVPR